MRIPPRPAVILFALVTGSPAGGRPRSPLTAPSPERRMPMRADREAVGFSTLDAWAGRIALRLAARGVRRGHRVLVLAEPSAGAVAAVLGVQRIGASHAIADPARPEPSIASAAAGCAAVVTTANGAAARWLADRGLPVVRADECREEPAADRASEPIPAFLDVA